jgi:acetyltransferase-like isoleucine patch superfamily enzyme
MIEAHSEGLRISSDVKLGRGVKFFGFVNLYGCEVGDESRIGCFVEIQRGAKIGARCKISSHSFICEGVTIEDEVFIGHGVMFTNDRRPKATSADGLILGDCDWECQPTLVKKGASIGSGATILCGLTIGEHAMVGAGSVVTSDIPAGITVVGNPARAIKNSNQINP